MSQNIHVSTFRNILGSNGENTVCREKTRRKVKVLKISPHVIFRSNFYENTMETRLRKQSRKFSGKIYENLTPTLIELEVSLPFMTSIKFLLDRNFSPTTLVIIVSISKASQLVS